MQPVAEANAAPGPPATASYERVVEPLGKNNTGKSLSKITETGVCSWISGGSMNQSKFYALHRTAPPGTIIRVTNKMNGRHVFVKVVGVLPDTGDNQHAILKISESAVDKLGVLDAQFLVELNYGLVN
jgi:rare lipoprotein A (peptidoglycan hydrolase)